MRGRLGWSSVASASVFVVMLDGSAHAQALDALRVERGAGAEECADAAGLGERIVRIRGRTDTPKNANYAVSFARAADTFSASIRSGPNGESQRVLEGHGPTCAALSQATAVTLALLLDSEAENAPPPPPDPPPPQPKVARRPDEPQLVERPRSPPRLDGTLALGVAGLAFVLRPLSPAFVGEVGLRLERVRFGLGVLWNPTQSLALDPGRVHEALLSGTARSCVALSRTPSLQLDVCSGVLVGAVSAEAEGFTSNEQRRRTFLAIPLELSVADLSGSVGWEVSATALGSLIHRDFRVEGLGEAYHAPRVGALLTVRAVGLLDWN